MAPGATTEEMGGNRGYREKLLLLSCSFGDAGSRGGEADHEGAAFARSNRLWAGHCWQGSEEPDAVASAKAASTSLSIDTISDKSAESRVTSCWRVCRLARSISGVWLQRASRPIELDDVVEHEENRLWRGGKRMGDAERAGEVVGDG